MYQKLSFTCGVVVFEIWDRKIQRQRERRLKRELSNALLVLIAIIPTHLLFQI